MKQNRRLSVLVVLATVFTSGTNGYGSGAPSSPGICQKMLPGHGAEPQTSPSPFGISISNLKPMGGDTVKINLTAPVDQYFKGFLAIVKQPGVANSAIGKFKVTSDPLASAIGCFDKPHSAMTHNSNAEKRNVTLEWVAPNEADIAALDFV